MGTVSFEENVSEMGQFVEAEFLAVNPSVFGRKQVVIAEISLDR